MDYWGKFLFNGFFYWFVSIMYVNIVSFFLKNDYINPFFPVLIFLNVYFKSTTFFLVIKLELHYIFFAYLFYFFKSIVSIFIKVYVVIKIYKSF